MASIGTGNGQIFADIGLYRGAVVSIKSIKKEHIQLSRQLLKEFNEVLFEFANDANQLAIVSSVEKWSLYNDDSQPRD